MACPACRAEGRNAPSENWRHGAEKGVITWMFKPCNGKLLLDEKANVICAKCGSSKFLLNTELSCNSGRHKFATANNLSYAEVISTASHIVNSGGVSYLQNILKHIN